MCFPIIAGFALLRAYVLPKYDLYTLPDEIGKTQVRTSCFEYLATKFLSSLYPDVEHSFNTVNRQRLVGYLPDAISKSAGKVFNCDGCRIHGHWIKTSNGILVPCPYMLRNATPNSHNIFNEKYVSITARFEQMKKSILTNCPQIKEVVVIHQCEFEKDLKTEGTAVYQFYHDEQKKLKAPKEKPKQLVPRNALRGGATQLLQLVAKSDGENVIHYDDINSLYPNEAIRRKFVSGKPIHLLGDSMVSRLSIDPKKKFKLARIFSID